MVMNISKPGLLKHHFMISMNQLHNTWSQAAKLARQWIKDRGIIYIRVFKSKVYILSGSFGSPVDNKEAKEPSFGG